MSHTAELIMEFDKPHFRVKLHSDILHVDLKEGFRKELEDVLESKPIIRETLGFLFQSVIPLDVMLRDIQSATVDKKGQVKIAIPRRKDLTIPLEEEESVKLVEKLNELIPIEKARHEEQEETSDEAMTEHVVERAEAEAEDRSSLPSRM
jgi:hypothetical protein